MKLIKRNSCAVTLIQDLEPLYIFKQFPVFMGCSKNSESDDLHADMVWMISKSSGLIQLGELLPLDVLYLESHGAGCVGELWNKHHKAFASFLHRFRPSSVFEIGGHHGILAKEYCVLNDIPWTILEPNPAPVAGTNARFIKGFFNNQFYFDEPYDAVVHSHVFEHVYNPDEFIGHLSYLVDEGKYLIFAIPNLQAHLEHKFTYFIGFEHTVFLIEPYVEYLLSKHGFRLVQKEYFMDDVSIFYAAVRDKSIKPKELQKGLYEKNKKLYQDYLIYHENLVSELNNKIKMHSTKQNIYLFGAHIFAQYLIAFGLDTARINCILDNDRNKHGKRLYGTSLLVNSPKILKDNNSPIVILRSGVFNEEIKKDILENINPDVTFWE